MKQLNLFSDSSQRWIKEMRVEAVKICHEQGEVSADDIRSKCKIPSDVSHNAMGSLFKTKEFTWKGIKKSTNPTRAGAIISVWKLTGE